MSHESIQLSPPPPAFSLSLVFFHTQPHQHTDTTLAQSVLTKETHTYTRAIAANTKARTYTRAYLLSFVDRFPLLLHRSPRPEPLDGGSRDRSEDKAHLSSPAQAAKPWNDACNDRNGGHQRTERDHRRMAQQYLAATEDMSTPHLSNTDPRKPSIFVSAAQLIGALKSRRASFPSVNVYTPVHQYSLRGSESSRNRTKDWATATAILRSTGNRTVTTLFP